MLPLQLLACLDVQHHLVACNLVSQCLLQNAKTVSLPNSAPEPSKVNCEGAAWFVEACNYMRKIDHVSTTFVPNNAKTGLIVEMCRGMLIR
jgi:hypothetical protein